MRTVCIGDVHGRRDWVRIVNTNHCDRVVFMGDEFDSFDISREDQLKNFLDIIEFKKQGYPEVIMLWGNHTISYILQDAGCTGYAEFPAPIRFVLEDNKEHLQMAYKQDGILFTHAGVTKTWLDNTSYKVYGAGPSELSTVDLINTLWKLVPEEFLFQTRNHYVDPYGDNTFQGPCWVRPESLMKDGIEGVIQVCGHTNMKHIESKLNGKFWFIDALPEFLVVEEDGTISVGK